MCVCVYWHCLSVPPSLPPRDVPSHKSPLPWMPLHPSWVAPALPRVPPSLSGLVLAGQCWYHCFVISTCQLESVCGQELVQVLVNKDVKEQDSQTEVWAAWCSSWSNFPLGTPWKCWGLGEESTCSCFQLFVVHSCRQKGLRTPCFLGEGEQL